MKSISGTTEWITLILIILLIYLIQFLLTGVTRRSCISLLSGNMKVDFRLTCGELAFPLYPRITRKLHKAGYVGYE